MSRVLPLSFKELNLQLPADHGLASIHIAKAMLAAGLLVIAAGPSVVRLLPPLNVTDEEVETALSIFRRVLDAAV